MSSGVRLLLLATTRAIDFGKLVKKAENFFALQSIRSAAADADVSGAWAVGIFWKRSSAYLMSLPTLARTKYSRMPRLTLAQTGLILVILPMIVQVALMAKLAQLRNEAEAEAVQAEKARDISDSTNQLMRAAYVVIGGIMDAIDKASPLSASYYTGSGEMDETSQRLKELVRGNPNDMAIVDDAIKYGDKIRQEAEYSIKHPSEFPQHSEPRMQVFRHLRSNTKVLSRLVMLGKQKKEIASESHEYQARVRQQDSQVLIIGTVINISLLVMAGFFFARTVVRRLVCMIDNTDRLAMQQPLNPPVPGSDEIAILDGAFHSMAEALVESSRKERAIVENARDLICTLDERYKFVAISPASKAVLDYTPDQLMGRRLIDLVVPDDAEHARHELAIIMEGGAEPPFEIRLIRKDATVIDVVWSAVWSDTERTMFCVAHDISERKRAERLRQEVVQMVSHDLRSPLFAIQGVLEMLGAGMIGHLDADQQRLLSAADRSAARMLTLVNDLLDIERMEAGMLQLEKKDMPLAAAFEQAIHTTQPLAQAKGITLKLLATDLAVFADGDRIIQVLINLLSNAVKFSPQGEVVTLAAEPVSGFARITVTDHGRGIPPHLTKAIFDRFKQVEAADAQKGSGSGLGLAICKALVEMHGGEIHVISELGKGSQFVFTIPLDSDSVRTAHTSVISHGSEANVVSESRDLS